MLYVLVWPESGTTSDWSQLMWDRNVLLWFQYGFWKAVVMASVSSPLARTASPFHLCTAPPPHLGSTFGASEIRQKFSWSLSCCFAWFLQVLLSLKQKKASRNSVSGLTWVFQEGIEQLEGSRCWGLPLKTQNKQEMTFFSYDKGVTDNGPLSLPNSLWESKSGEKF